MQHAGTKTRRRGKIIAILTVSVADLNYDGGVDNAIARPLLDSFTDVSRILVNQFDNVANSQLLTGAEIAGDTVGLAWVRCKCLALKTAGL